MTDKEKIEELEKENERLENKIDSLQDDYESLECENSRYEDKVDELESDLSELESNDDTEIESISTVLDRVYYTSSSDTIIEGITDEDIKNALLNIKNILWRK